MSLYDRRVLPRLLDLVMRQETLAGYRARTVAAAHGDVLEVGIGSGLNLQFYGKAVSHLTGIDPSAELLAMAERRTAGAPCPVVLVQASAEALPLDDHAIDTVVMTWSLCSIPDPAAALAEMRRVLRPGGRLLFVEHGLAPEPSVRKWQNRLTPCWRHVGGGCHLNRKMDDLIRAAGFEIVSLDTGYMTGPRLLTFLYQGSATPGA